MKKSLKVACAVIQKEQSFFAAQRSKKSSFPMLWEFPGGKIESHESPEECVVREVNEELSMLVIPIKRLNIVVHEYEQFIVELTPIHCESLSTSHKLNEHENAGWFTLEEASTLDWCPADIPIINSLGTQIRSPDK